MTPSAQAWGDRNPNARVRIVRVEPWQEPPVVIATPVGRWARSLNRWMNDTARGNPVARKPAHRGRRHAW